MEFCFCQKIVKTAIFGRFFKMVHKDWVLPDGRFRKLRQTPGTWWVEETNQWL